MIPEDTLEALKREHDEVHVLTAAGVTIAVKSPSEPSFDRFTSMLAKHKDTPARAFKGLLSDCVVYPSAQEWAAIVARKPGLVMTFGGECAKIAGLEDEVERKKA